jgi:hypothetical protein
MKKKFSVEQIVSVLKQAEACCSILSAICWAGLAPVEQS